MDSLETLQEYLDRTGTAVLTGDWEGYAAGVALPFTLVTETDSLTVETETSLREGFDSFTQMLKLHGVTDYIRLAESAVCLEEHLLSGSYITHILRGGHRIVQPYSSQITLREDAGVWRAVTITTAHWNQRWPRDLPQV